MLEIANVQEQVYDILYTLYQIETADYGNNSFLPNTYKFEFTIEELFLATPRNHFILLKDFRAIILKTSFLSIDRREHIVCEDIASLRAVCYKSRQKKEILRQEGI